MKSQQFGLYIQSILANISYSVGIVHFFYYSLLLSISISLDLHSSDMTSEYRLAGKYMRQPGLMKMHRTFTDKTCLLSDVVFITFTHFLNSAHPSLKYGLQFFKIDIPQNLLQALKELVLVSQLNPFEFFLDCKKQIEATKGQII
jgi:hypothetical protein